MDSTVITALAHRLTMLEIVLFCFVHVELWKMFALKTPWMTKVRCEMPTFQDQAVVIENTLGR